MVMTDGKIVRIVGFGLPTGTVLAALGVGALYGAGTAILILAGGVLLGVVAIMWASVRTLSGDSPITLEEAIAMGAPRAAEEQKRAVLQALKDLEYERSVGKIAETDYEELLHRYRADAKRLLRAVDEDLAPLRAKAAAYVATHLGQDAPAKSLAPDDDSKKMPLSTVNKTEKKAKTSPCPSCQVDNDDDALFCKKCGTKLVEAKGKDKVEDRADADE
jgi:zinc-ribbon domain